MLFGPFRVVQDNAEVSAQRLRQEQEGIRGALSRVEATLSQVAGAAQMETLGLVVEEQRRRIDSILTGERRLSFELSFFLSSAIACICQLNRQLKCTRTRLLGFCLAHFGGVVLVFAIWYFFLSHMWFAILCVRIAGDRVHHGGVRAAAERHRGSAELPVAAAAPPAEGAAARGGRAHQRWVLRSVWCCFLSIMLAQCSTR